MLDSWRTHFALSAWGSRQMREALLWQWHVAFFQSARCALVFFVSWAARGNAVHVITTAPTEGRWLGAYVEGVERGAASAAHNTLHQSRWQERSVVCELRGTIWKHKHRNK